MACPYMHDSVWLQQRKFEDAEAFYQKVLVGSSTTGAQQGGCSGAAASSGGGDATARIENLEKENKELRNAVDEMKSLVQKLEGRVKILEGGSSAPAASAAPSAATAVAPAAASAAADDDDSDSDVDLFGSEDEEEVAERERVKQERVKAYQEKKAKKPALVAKSSVILDVKPYDDETDMKAVEDSLRLIKQDGLVWGAAKLVPLAYGIKKLQIGIVIEDAKVSVEELSEKITEDYEDLVQSVDIAAFNKL
ncbi:elongation factor 1-delta-like isoform X2 [Ylistrum balloti]|uniref:elongation factor 1-delta-like isoform X2 n=1 Tax=Ylistrum balloti TaxID=509963 RepID=UPI0029058457|nr:elongation factor 1-delta-like isoform X2 [Ylistrum balloti]